MFKFFKKIRVAIKGAKLWVAALDYSRGRDYEKAKEKLIDMEKIGVHPNIEYCLLRGFIEYISGCKQEASKFLELSIGKISTVTRLSDNEKKYLNAYAQSMLNEMNTSQENYKTIVFDNIKLPDISNDLKGKFPLIDHPNWKV
ncbi:MAG: hypothetical protein HRT38_17815 [Alteromonadaceae bacterium]|nr:hypothetical protein [Alteromonadaceae bacterium]